ncbi:hypothetical protein OHR68_30285 [Spirillospora sp. NBC_00431]
MFFAGPIGAYESLTARMMALAVARPLLALDASKVKGERGWEDYRLTELALATIDVVALRADLKTAVRQEVIVEEIAEFAEFQVPGRPSAEYHAVARWVIERLINVEDRVREFRYPVGTASEGRFQLIGFPFQILREVPDEAGQPALTVTNEAINVLMHAIDVDVASSQVAAEAKLDALLKRARLPEARQAALDALFQSRRYARDLRDRIEAMKRNVRAVVWSQVQTEVEEAMEHLDARIDAEGKMQKHVNDLLDAATDDAHGDQQTSREHLTSLARTIEDCRSRHAALMDMLLQVGAEFRAQQDRQVFVAPSSSVRVHLRNQLLLPILELSVEEALSPLTAFGNALMGTDKPHVMFLPDFFEALADWRETADHEPVPIVLPQEYPPSPEHAVFTPDQETTANDLIGIIDEHGIRLSKLIAQARAHDQDLKDLPATGTDHLVVLHACSVFRNFPAVDLRRGAPAVIAIDDGTVFDDGVFSGTDLLLTLIHPAADVGEQTGQP